jgi:nitrate/nitrite-specific signal transduction histidine kinase
MTNKNSINASFWVKFVKQIKKFIKLFQKKTQQQKNTLQRIQLTFIYFFAIVVL